MDEYTCPNCGAVLNDQDGFDPDCGAWRCTECGEMLMDDDVYNNDMFEGVAWYCDNCGALLNRQSGFSDSYGSWTCTECGHINGTTEDEIINENEPEFTCPNCGVALDFQPGFDKYDDDWECTACGCHLHHSYSGDEYSVVEEPRYKCPNCDAGLDNQWGFDEFQYNWVCTECGAHLHHDYSSEDYSVMKHICPSCGAPLDIQMDFDEDNDDWECTECGAYLHHDYGDDEYEEVEDNNESSDNSTDDTYTKDNSSHTHSSSSNAYSGSYSGTSTKSDSPKSASSIKSKSKSETLKKKTNWKITFRGVITFFFLLLIAIVCYEMKLLVPVGYASLDLQGQDYEYVVAALEQSGFTNVKVEEIFDLSVEQLSEDNKVDYIKIGFAYSFGETSKFPSNFPVKITYHTLKKYAVPMSSKEAKGSNYQDVVKRFEEAGFELITIEVEYDIITGWLTDDGEVESVTVNGDKKFSEGDEYRADAEIVITYHTYKKNKPK